MDVDGVVVVGAGPAGLAATIALARNGIKVLLIERRDSGSDLPRATVLSVRSMELLRSWGLAEHVRAHADEVQMTMLTTSTVAHAAQGIPVEVGYPSDAQSAVLSPTRVACVAQDHLERVLLEHLSTLPTVSMLRGSEVVDVETNARGATVTVRDQSQRLTTVRTQYVVGADGSRTAVRAALGIGAHGNGHVLQGARVEFHAPLWDALGEHRHLLYAITEPGASGVLLPAGGDRWLFAVTVGPNGDLGTQPGVEALRHRLQRGIDVPALEVRINRFDRFNSGTRIADTFSRDRVFLAGDAAHQVTPRGGTGLNIALADGVDLGWKLGWVLRGWAPEALLHSYEAERRPVVQHHIERSADTAGARREPATEVQVDLGARIKHAWVSLGISTLDLVSDGLTLMTADAEAWRSAIGTREALPPITVVQIGPLTARSLGLTTCSAVLLRPDAVAMASFRAPSTYEAPRFTTSAA